MSCISTCVLFAMPKVDNLAKGWIGSVGAKTGAAVVHAAKMPTRYILARESMQVQCDGAMADVKMLPAFTAKRSPGCFSYISTTLRNGTQICKWWWYGQVAKTLSTYLSMPPATACTNGCQETVYLENPDDHTCLDLRADAPQGASPKNTSWQGPLQHCLYLSMEKHPSLSSPVYSLGSDSLHQWREHGPGTTSAGLWVTHNNDPITNPSLPPPPLFACPTTVSRGQTVPHR